MLYSGKKDKQKRDRVALIMEKKAKNSFMEWEPEPISHRILMARFFHGCATPQYYSTKWPSPCLRLQGYSLQIFIKSPSDLS